MTAAAIASGIHLSDPDRKYFECKSHNSDSALCSDLKNKHEGNRIHGLQRIISARNARLNKYTNDGDFVTIPLKDENELNALNFHPARQQSKQKQTEKSARREYYRLGKRKLIFQKKCRITDFALCFALSGLLLMIVETELTMAHIYSKESFVSIGIKTVISLTTAILLLLLTMYHALEVQLFMVDNGVEDWKIAISTERIVKFCVEIIICSFHPIPFTHYVNLMLPAGTSRTHNQTYLVPLDLLLSLPMFSRLYLVCRVMLLHSRMFTDASSRSIGALNRINFNSKFVLKALMTICPGTVILTFILTLFMVASWTVRACEVFNDPEKHPNILNSMWLISVTFLAVGYGDVVPQTYCGRAVCVASALMGVSCTATIVAVLARKLELTRAEKHVQNFMMDTQLNKRLRNTAANVLQQTWLIYKNTKLRANPDVQKVRQHQRKFLKAIYSLRKVKMEIKELNDNSNSITDMGRAVNVLSEGLNNVKNQQAILYEEIRKLSDGFVALKEQIDNLPVSLMQIMRHAEKHNKQV